MPKIAVTRRDGSRKDIVAGAGAGASLMQTLKDAGLDEIQALCGGCCSCATCHVYVEEPWFNRLGGQKEEEVELLECLSTRKRTSRLSCQIKVTETLDGLQVVIAPEEPGQ